MTASPCCQLEWGVAVRPLQGQRESGDRHRVIATQQGWLIAVVDGLGHGHEAAQASRLALAAIGECAGGSLSTLIQHCHEQLQGTRGVAISVAEISASESTLTWAGVGNVEGLLRHRDMAQRSRHIPLRGGIVGYRLPLLHTDRENLCEGDVLILATDGVEDGYSEIPLPQASAQETAERIMNHFARVDDDALVLVAQWKRRHDESTNQLRR